MSSTIAQVLQEKALEKLACERCEAEPGQRCTTLSGKNTKMHSVRWELLAWAYYEGRTDVTLGEDANLKGEAATAVYDTTSLDTLGLMNLFNILEQKGYYLVRAQKF